MCGILGFIIGENSAFPPQNIQPFINRLFLLSETRGKDASGLAVVNETGISIVKRPVRAKSLVHSKECIDLLSDFQSNYEISIRNSVRKYYAIFGHARMVTNGSEENHDNNQPVVKNGMVCFHNGIVVNDLQFWDTYPELKREYEVDTEAILSMISYQRHQGMPFTDSVAAVFQFFKGSNSIAIITEDLDQIILATTNGSLYYCRAFSGQEAVFGSEKYILEKAINHGSSKRSFKRCPVVQIKPGQGCMVNLANLEQRSFSLKYSNNGIDGTPTRHGRRIIRDIKPLFSANVKYSYGKVGYAEGNINNLEKLFSVDDEAISRLKRCSHCLLPETFPFISYDEKSVCIYCNRHKKLEFKGEAALKTKIQDIRMKTDQPNCIVALSGGRDSSYGLHYIKQELGLNPIAYTYDWGMVTDLARRNISRVCGALGIEHILVSANIKEKRSHIRKNVQAWLKKPDLGTIPLFMAGDKQFLYHANKLMQQYGIDVFVMSENRLERTHFKHGFCGIKHSDFNKSPYFLSLYDKFKLACYYGKQYIQNPAYINSSLIDTIGAYISYYMIPHNYLYLYNYIPWEEDQIEKTLIDTYDWELSPDTKSSWRIGDGTAAFYNYIYYRVTGFTENDTFRSNQIRDGQINRDEAMNIVNEDNRPRAASIKWYCDTIGIDVFETIKRINEIPPLY